MGLPIYVYMSPLESRQLPPQMMSCDYTHKYAIRLSTSVEETGGGGGGGGRVGLAALLRSLFRHVRHGPASVTTYPDTHGYTLSSKHTPHTAHTHSCGQSESNINKIMRNGNKELI